MKQHVIFNCSCRSQLEVAVIGDDGPPNEFFARRPALVMFLIDHAPPGHFLGVRIDTEAGP